jgi:hypothetical protein
MALLRQVTESAEAAEEAEQAASASTTSFILYVLCLTYIPTHSLFQGPADASTHIDPALYNGADREFLETGSYAEGEGMETPGMTIHMISLFYACTGHDAAYISC